MTPPIRRLLLLLVITSSAAQPAAGQFDDRRGFIGLGIGPSTPIGQFVDATATGPRSGRAIPGYTDTILNLGYRFRPNFGMAAAASYSEFPVHAEDDDWWQVATVTVGPMYSHQFTPRAALDLKAMVGMIVLTPIVDGHTTDDDAGAGLGLDLRVLFRYDVFRRWALFVDGGVQSTNASYGGDLRTRYAALVSGFGIAYRPTW